MLKKIKLVLLSAVSVLLLMGCNTIAGVGKDVEKAGEAVQGAAKKAQ